MLEKDYKKEFLNWLGANGSAKGTITTYERYTGRFLEWCTERKIQALEHITYHDIEAYQKYLYKKKDSDDKPISIDLQLRQLIAVKKYFLFLHKKRKTIINPAFNIVLPRVPRTLPKNILTSTEVKKVFKQPDLNKTTGKRDRTILELLYATGIRTTELIELATDDVDFTDKLLHIKDSKNNRDRVIPVSERALTWLKKYLTETRFFFPKTSVSKILFPTYEGNKFQRPAIRIMINHYFKTAGIKKNGSNNLFRHTLATMMLENGADIRYIQAMLGHRNLETTKIYTKVSIAKLKEVHTKTHPAKLRKQ